MNMRLIAFLGGALLLAGSAAASDGPLSATGADLGRLARPASTEDFTLAVRAEDVGVYEGFIVARFQTGQPAMKMPDGTWADWDGDPATLARVVTIANDGALVFSVGGWPTPDVSASCTFTVGYWADGVLKYGYVTVDGL